MSDGDRDDTSVAVECLRLIAESTAILARGREAFFDVTNPVEYGAARMTVIDLYTATEAFSDDYKAAHPDLPWKALARTRSKLAHHYEDINRELVWVMLTRELPRVATQLEQALGQG